MKHIERGDGFVQGDHLVADASGDDVHVSRAEDLLGSVDDKPRPPLDDGADLFVRMFVLLDDGTKGLEIPGRRI